MTKVLEGVITSGTGAGYTSIGCQSEAGKTGTSEDLSDAWFVGYTPLYSTAVWTGHPLSRDYTGFGGPTSGPIWRSYMEAAQGGELPRIRGSRRACRACRRTTGSTRRPARAPAAAAPIPATPRLRTTDLQLRRHGDSGSDQQPGRLRARGRTETGSVAEAEADARAGAAGRAAAAERRGRPRAELSLRAHLAWVTCPASEFDLIAAINERLPAPGPRVRVPSGDDAAVVEPRAASAITVDAIVDGVHFRLAIVRPGGGRPQGARRRALRPGRDGGVPRARRTSWSRAPDELADEDLLGIADGLAEVGDPGGGHDRRRRPGPLAGAGRLGDRGRL